MLDFVRHSLFVQPVDPFTCAVQGFKELALKNTGLLAVVPDLAFLALFALVAMTAATALFRRTL